MHFIYVCVLHQPNALENLHAGQKKIIIFLSIYNQKYVDQSISCLLTCAYLCNLLRLSVQKKSKKKQMKILKKKIQEKAFFDSIYRNILIKTEPQYVQCHP